MHDRWWPGRGTWTPQLTPAARLAATRALVAGPLAYGADYLLPGATDALPASYSLLEQQLPIQAWGILHLIAAAIMITGLAGQWRRITITGFFTAGAVLFTMAVGRMAAIITTPWWDGISGPVTVGACATLCWAAAAGFTLTGGRDG